MSRVGPSVRCRRAVDPDRKEVHVSRRYAPTEWLSEQDELDGEDVVRAFRCRLERLFDP